MGMNETPAPRDIDLDGERWSVTVHDRGGAYYAQPGVSLPMRPSGLDFVSASGARRFFPTDLPERLNLTSERRFTDAELVRMCRSAPPLE